MRRVLGILAAALVAGCAAPVIPAPSPGPADTVPPHVSCHFRQTCVQDRGRLQGRFDI